MRINFFRRNPIEGLVVAGSDVSDSEAEISGSDSNKIVWVDLKDRQLLGDTGLLGGAGGAVGGALSDVTSGLGDALGGVTSDLGVSATLGLGLDATTTAPNAAASTTQPPTSADSVTTSSAPATTEVSTPPSTTTSTPPVIVPVPVTAPTTSLVTSTTQAPAPVTTTTTQAPQVVSTLDTAPTKSSTTAITSATTQTHGVPNIPISSAAPSSTTAAAATSDLTSDPSTSSTGDPTTFLTSASPTQAADSSPTDTSSTTKASTGAGVDNGPNNPNASNTISETASNQSGMSTTTTVIIVVGVIVGVSLFGAGFHFFRRFLRARRIARAESPPSSPLLRAADEKSPFPPMSAHSRSPSAQSNYSANHSEFWPSTRGSTVLGPRAEQVLGRMDSFRNGPQNPPLSPLPPAAMGNPAGYRLYPPQAPGDWSAPAQPRAY